MLEEVAVGLQRVARPGRSRAARRTSAGSRTSARQRSAASSGRRHAAARTYSSQARYSREVVEEQARLSLEGVEAACAARSSRAWKSRRVTAARSRTSAVRPPGSSSISPTAKPRSLSRRTRAADREAVPGWISTCRKQLAPRAACSGSRTASAASICSSIVVGPALEGGQVGEAEGDVLDEDVQVVGALPVRERRVDLARLGVDEVGRERVAVAPEERVGQRAVAPVDAGPVEVDEEPGHGIEEAVAVAARLERHPHQEAAVLERVAEELGDEDRVALVGPLGDPDRRGRPGSPACSMCRSASYSRRATSSGSSLRA